MQRQEYRQYAKCTTVLFRDGSEDHFAVGARRLFMQAENLAWYKSGESCSGLMERSLLAHAQSHNIFVVELFGQVAEMVARYSRNLFACFSLADLNKSSETPPLVRWSPQRPCYSRIQKSRLNVTISAKRQAQRYSYKDIRTRSVEQVSFPKVYLFHTIGGWSRVV